MRTAWSEARTQVVPDVDQFPGHIACSSLSRSENCCSDNSEWRSKRSIGYRQ